MVHEITRGGVSYENACGEQELEKCGRNYPSNTKNFNTLTIRVLVAKQCSYSPKHRTIAQVKRGSGPEPTRRKQGGGHLIALIKQGGRPEVAKLHRRD